MPRLWEHGRRYRMDFLAREVNEWFLDKLAQDLWPKFREITGS